MLLVMLPLANSAWLLVIIGVLLVMFVVFLGVTLMAMERMSDHPDNGWYVDVTDHHHVHVLPAESKPPYDHEGVPYDWEVDA